MARSSLAALVVALPALLAACATAPVQSVPRSEAVDAADLRLVGVVTTAGDTVRFDLPRASDPPERRLETPRGEQGEVRATVRGASWRLPVEEVATWLHREPESNRTLLVASAVGLAVVATTLVFVLGGGFD